MRDITRTKQKIAWLIVAVLVVGYLGIFTALNQEYADDLVGKATNGFTFGEQTDSSASKTEVTLQNTDQILVDGETDLIFQDGGIEEMYNVGISEALANAFGRGDVEVVFIVNDFEIERKVVDTSNMFGSLRSINYVTSFDFTFQRLGDYNLQARITKDVGIAPMEFISNPLVVHVASSRDSRNGPGNDGSVISDGSSGQNVPEGSEDDSGTSDSTTVFEPGIDEHEMEAIQGRLNLINDDLSRFNLGETTSRSEAREEIQRISGTGMALKIIDYILAAFGTDLTGKAVDTITYEISLTNGEVYECDEGETWAGTNVEGAITIEDSASVTIKNCNFNGFNTAIYASNANSVILEGNSFTNVETSVDITSKMIEFSDNTFTGNLNLASFSGMVYGGSIENIHIDSAEEGIYVVDSSVSGDIEIVGGATVDFVDSTYTNNIDFGKGYGEFRGFFTVEHSVEYEGNEDNLIVTLKNEDDAVYHFPWTQQLRDDEYLVFLRDHVKPSAVVGGSENTIESSSSNTKRFTLEFTDHGEVVHSETFDPKNLGETLELSFGEPSCYRILEDYYYFDPLYYSGENTDPSFFSVYYPLVVDDQYLICPDQVYDINLLERNELFEDQTIIKFVQGDDVVLTCDYEETNINPILMHHESIIILNENPNTVEIRSCMINGGLFMTLHGQVDAYDTILDNVALKIDNSVLTKYFSIYAKVLDFGAPVDNQLVTFKREGEGFEEHTNMHGRTSKLELISHVYDSAGKEEFPWFVFVTHDGEEQQIENIVFNAPEELVFNFGRCTGNECASGTECNLETNICEEIVNACIDESECADGESCVEGICVAEELPEIACTEDGDCGSNQECSNNVCVEVDDDNNNDGNNNNNNNGGRSSRSRRSNTNTCYPVDANECWQDAKVASCKDYVTGQHKFVRCEVNDKCNFNTNLAWVRYSCAPQEDSFAMFENPASELSIRSGSSTITPTTNTGGNNQGLLGGGDLGGTPAFVPDIDPSDIPDDIYDDGFNYWWFLLLLIPLVGLGAGYIIYDREQHNDNDKNVHNLNLDKTETIQTFKPNPTSTKSQLLQRPTSQKAQLYESSMNELRRFIIYYRKQGYSDDEIAKTLRKAGWHDQVIKSYME